MRDPYVISLALLSLPLFLFGLGSTYLWQDEAQTALLGRSILQHGVPMVGTGAESLSAHMGSDAGIDGIYFQISWLQAYLVAGSLWLFGESSWAARIPFAIAGWLCVALVAWMMQCVGANRTATRLAALLTATCVPFIVCSRQARYYALTAAVTTVVAGAYSALRQRVRDHRPLGSIPAVFAAGATLLVLSFDVTAIGVLGVIAVHWWFSSGNDVRRAGAFWLPWSVAAVVLIGWIVLSSSAASRRTHGNVADVPDRFAHGIPYYANQIDAHVLPLPVAAVAVAASLRGPTRPAVMILALFIVGGIGGAMLSPYRFFRYAMPVVPIVLSLAALGLSGLAARGRLAKVIAGILVIVLVGSNALNVLSHTLLARLANATGFITVRERQIHNRVPLAELLRELRDPPKGPIAATVEYLRQHAGRGDVVVTTYGELPLKFHTSLQVYGGETAQLPSDGVHATWIWPRPSKAYAAEQPSVEWVQRELSRGGYLRIELDAVDRRWENREDPEEHIFSNPGPPGPRVVIYRAVE
jgi:4-amino-4-deoxy-L-arabinose transferase-like glycosyltransferase